MHLAAEDDIHDPPFQIAALDADDVAVVTHAEHDLAAVEVGQGDDLFGEAFRPLLIALELNAGVLPVGDELA